MAQLRITLPDNVYEKLNDFYIKEYGYDINTHAVTFLLSEYDHIKEEVTEHQEMVTHAYIGNIKHKGKDTYSINIRNPDGSKRQYINDDYETIVKVYKEWSKYNFDDKYKETVLEKIIPDYYRNIGIEYNQYKVYSRKNGKRNIYGYYPTIHEALQVRNFMDKHNWSEEYLFTNLKKNGLWRNAKKYNEYMLNISSEE